MSTSNLARFKNLRPPSLPFFFVQKKDVNTMDDNHIVTMLPEDDVCHHHIQQLDLDLAQKISNSSMSDPIITKALAAMNNADIDPWLP